LGGAAWKVVKRPGFFKIGKSKEIIAWKKTRRGFSETGQQKRLKGKEVRKAGNCFGRKCEGEGSRKRGIKGRNSSRGKRPKKTEKRNPGLVNVKGIKGPGCHQKAAGEGNTDIKKEECRLS